MGVGGGWGGANVCRSVVGVGWRYAACPCVGGGEVMGGGGGVGVF